MLQQQHELTALIITPSLETRYYTTDTEQGHHQSGQVCTAADTDKWSDRNRQNDRLVVSPTTLQEQHGHHKLQAPAQMGCLMQQSDKHCTVV